MRPSTTLIAVGAAGVTVRHVPVGRTLRTVSIDVVIAPGSQALRPDLDGAYG